MFITLTPLAGEPFDINPDHIVLVEAVGGDRPHTKLLLVTREQVQVRESRAEIRALCTLTVNVSALETFTPGPTEVKTADAAVDSVAEAIVSGRKRK